MQACVKEVVGFFFESGESIFFFLGGAEKMVFEIKKGKQFFKKCKKIFGQMKIIFGLTIILR
jgi:hypothetical protein